MAGRFSTSSADGSLRAGSFVSERVCLSPERTPRLSSTLLSRFLKAAVMLFLAVPAELQVLARFALRIVMLPITVGVGYEIIKFVGRHDNAFTRIISAPGLWLQRLTTKEPDREQLEVAIASLKAVMPQDKNEAQW